MALRIGDTAPNFEIDTTQGKVNFHEWAKDSWVFFFSHPADYTPVCTTEMGQTSKLAPEFEKRNVKCLGLSTDNVEQHKGWIQDINETQDTVLEFPIVADKERKVAELYDMIHPNEDQNATIRSVFIIDPSQKVRLIMTYPMTVGRNFDEILRVIDALQTTDQQEVACPANWRPGDDVIIRPTVSNEDAKAKFPQGWKELRPYLRFTTI